MSGAVLWGGAEWKCQRTGQLPSTAGDGAAEGLTLRPTGVERHPLHLWPQGIILEEEEEEEKEMKEGEDEK